MAIKDQHILPDTEENITAASEEITLKDVVLKLRSWRVYLFKRGLFILSIGIICAALGVAYATVKKPRYVAATTFVLDGGKGSGGGLASQYAGLASLAGLDMGNNAGIFDPDNIIELYLSRRMIQATLLSKADTSANSALLVEEYLDINNFRDKWKENKVLQSVAFSTKQPLTRLQDSLLKTFADDIKANYLSVGKPDKKLSIIEVSVKSKNEAFSEAFDRRLVETVNSFYVQTKAKKSLQNLAVLQYQVDSVKTMLSASLYSSAAIADETPNLNPTRLKLRVPGQKFQFNAEASKAILTQLVQNLELAKINVRNETPLIQVIDSPVMPLTIDKPSKIKMGLVGLFVGLFLSVLYVTVGRVYANIMAA